MKNTHPLFNLIIITLVVFGASVVAQFVGILTASLVVGKDLVEVTNILLEKSSNFPQQREILWIIQAFSLLAGLGGGAFLYQSWVARGSFSDLNLNPKIDRPALLWVIAVFFFVLPLIAQIMQWNKEIHFGIFDESIRQTEAELELLTQKLTQMHDFGDFLIVLLIIAIIPAFAEEFLFRGLVQNEFLRWFKNPHLAVWVTGAIFSAIHFQFLGFFPRMILGALLGYVYVWSGNIFYPMLGHFVNNGVQVLALYLAQRNLVSEEIGKDDYQFPFLVTLSFGLLFAISLHFFYKRQKANAQTFET
ncbi:CPBP family intramembrane glutamic endopeptidase [Raineya orbicola]|jgi:membrane protease YdiL (CAAX protease family)|uniref:CAAX protease self-immunity n=1 Tax=Raineya orbicola TaxID=2016530 RepID=A0A2N3IIJ8_9BACT|nr:CPBP family intramembrane glutamic endopeptidase [Raineya orbicola]PKQ70078.1 CAAX protease self-immunity [Raineya orbicola]